MTDSYIYIIIALLPLASCMVVFQVNPYHALVIRGILGAVAAMVYALLGAPDVALTEALVGTMLAVTLNAIAVRSSLIMRLGVIKDEAIEAVPIKQFSSPKMTEVFSPTPSFKEDEDSFKNGKVDHQFEQLMDELRTIFSKHYMRLELVPYTNTQALHQALIDKEVHAICTQPELNDQDFAEHEDKKQPYHTKTRIQRLYEIMKNELSSPETILTYVNTSDLREAIK